MAERERIGIVGVGRMGLAMAKHLIEHGYPVTACDLDKKQCDSARAVGAEIVATPAALGKVARFVIIGVGYDPEVRAVMLGKGGLMESLAAGSIIAVSSTCAPGERQGARCKCAGERDRHARRADLPRRARG